MLKWRQEKVKDKWSRISCFRIPEVFIRQSLQLVPVTQLWIGLLEKSHKILGLHRQSWPWWMMKKSPGTITDWICRGSTTWFGVIYRGLSCLLRGQTFQDYTDAEMRSGRRSIKQDLWSESSDLGTYGSPRGRPNDLLFITDLGVCRCKAWSGNFFRIKVTHLKAKLHQFSKFFYRSLWPWRSQKSRCIFSQMNNLGVIANSKLQNKYSFL